MAQKYIQTIKAPSTPHMVGDGFRVHRMITDMQQMDPFIVMDYNAEYYFEPSDKPKGVGVHPHKGFETVTIAYQGKVAHEDSSGGGGVIGEGDVQWMTAGSGVLHKEFHEKEFSKKGGNFQMVQLWVNLPAEYKNTDPKYQSITHDDVKKYQLPDGAGTIEVIAGQYRDTEGSAFTFSPVHLQNARLNKGGQAQFSFPAEYSTALLVVEGNVNVNGSEAVEQDHFALFGNDGEDFTVEATEDSIVLVLSGEPLNEPMAAQGPFVMNTREELMQAFKDFQAGKFGSLKGN